MFNDFEILNTGSWQKDLDKLMALRREIDQASSEVPTMRAYLERRYKQKVDEMAPKIKAAVIAEQQASQQEFRKAEEASRQAYSHELARWDAGKFATAKANVLDRVESIRRSGSMGTLKTGPDKLEKLKSLQAELMASSDIHVRRAAAEVFAEEIGEMSWDGTTRDGTPIRHNLGELMNTARDALKEIRMTPEQTSTMGKLSEAYDDLADKQQQLVDVGKLIGDDPTSFFAFGDLAKAFKQVRFNPDGTVQLFAPDSPEVTGIDMSRVNLEVER